MPVCAQRLEGVLTRRRCGVCLLRQVLPTQPELVKALGDALDWCTLYEGRDRHFTLDRLPGKRVAASRERAWR